MNTYEQIKRNAMIMELEKIANESLDSTDDSIDLINNKTSMMRQRGVNNTSARDAVTADYDNMKIAAFMDELQKIAAGLRPNYETLARQWILKSKGGVANVSNTIKSLPKPPAVTKNIEQVKQAAMIDELQKIAAGSRPDYAALAKEWISKAKGNTGKMSNTINSLPKSQSVMKDVEQIKHASMIDELQKIAFNIDLKMGDVILTGKWKNVREIVKKFGTNDVGQPTVNGKSLLNS